MLLLMGFLLMDFQVQAEPGWSIDVAQSRRLSEHRFLLVQHDKPSTGMASQTSFSVLDGNGHFLYQLPPHPAWKNGLLGDEDLFYRFTTGGVLLHIWHPEHGAKLLGEGALETIKGETQIRASKDKRSFFLLSVSLEPRDVLRKPEHQKWIKPEDVDVVTLMEVLRFSGDATTLFETGTFSTDTYALPGRLYRSTTHHSFLVWGEDDNGGARQLGQHGDATLQGKTVFSLDQPYTDLRFVGSYFYVSLPSGRQFIYKGSSVLFEFPSVSNDKTVQALRRFEYAASIGKIKAVDGKIYFLDLQNRRHMIDLEAFKLYRYNLKDELMHFISEVPPVRMEHTDGTLRVETVTFNFDKHEPVEQWDFGHLRLE